MLPHKAAGTGYNDKITLKEGCWIGANSTILPGVSIGKCSIIAAGSVVNKPVPDYCLYAGNPAIFKKKLR
nr:acyltransferase [Acinetobacter sp. YH12231]